MLRRVVSVYFCIAPLTLATLCYAYHPIGLRAGVARAAAHLVLMALGMWAGMFNQEVLTNHVWAGKTASQRLCDGGVEDDE